MLAIPVTLVDADLAVWADERLLAGDPVGEFVNRQLAGRECSRLLFDHGADWLGPLAQWVVPPGSWERARLVGVELAGEDPRPLLDALQQVPTVRLLDLGAQTLMKRERQWVWDHRRTATLWEVRFRMPATWLVSAAEELERAPVPCFTVVMPHGELRFTRQGRGFALEACGQHPLIGRSVKSAQRALPVRSVVHRRS